MDRAIRLLVLLMLPSVSFGAIAFDGVVASSMTASSSPLGISITVADQTNRYMVVQCAIVGDADISGVTVGGSAATRINEHWASSTFKSIQYGYANPATGVVSVSISYTAGDDSNINCAALSLNGVDQSDSVDVSTGVTVQDGGSGNPSLSATTTNDNSYIVSLIYHQSTNVPTEGAGQTRRYTFANATQGIHSLGSTKETTTAGSQSVSWTNEWDNNVIVFTALNESTGGSPASSAGGELIFTPGSGMATTSPGSGRITLE